MASRQRTEHYCEYTPPGSLGGLYRETVEKEIQTVARNMSKTIGTECLEVNYRKHRSYESNFCFLTRRPPSTFEQINFQFTLNKMLGLNITFTTFVLSDMCVMAHPYIDWYYYKNTFNCFWHKGTEYVLLDQRETDYTDKLYFCVRRPYWSVYTGYVVAIGYSFCTVCVHHVSRIVFCIRFWTLDSYKTVKDEFRKVYYTESRPLNVYFKPFVIICKPVKDLCSSLKFQYYYLRGEKYEQIHIWRKRRGPNRVVLLSFSEVTRKIEEIVSRKKSIKVPTFHCIIQIQEHYVLNNGASPVDILMFGFHQSKTKPVKLNDKADMVTVHLNNCVIVNKCHRVLKLSSSHASIRINHMKFTGWKVHSCLFGGVSVHEKEVLEGDDITKRTYMEIYDLCDNVTNLETRVETSMFVTNRSHSPTVPYYSASDETLIVVYSEPQYTLNVSFTVSHSQCRGVFVNPCPLEKHSTRPLTFPRQYEDRILHFTTSFNNTNECLHLQFSLQYMFTSGRYNREAARYGCARRFNMRRNTPAHLWCALEILSIVQNIQLYL